MRITHAPRFIEGIDVLAHAARHESGGADAIDSLGATTFKGDVLIDNSGTKATITRATGYARFGDASAPTVSLEAANGFLLSAGDLDIGALGLKTTNLYLSQKDVNTLAVGSTVGTANKALQAGWLGVTTATGILALVDAMIFSANNNDDDYIVGKARDNGVGVVEVFRMQGAADPEFQTGNNGNATRSSYAGLLGFFGTAPQAQPTGVAVDAAGIHAALVTLGLITA